MVADHRVIRRDDQAHTGAPRIRERAQHIIEKGTRHAGPDRHHAFRTRRCRLRLAFRQRRPLAVLLHPAAEAAREKDCLHESMLQCSASATA